MTKISFGMATYDDAPGVWMTVQALRLYHGVTDEIIIVDNNPKSPHGQSVRNFCDWAKNCRYIPFDGVTGTSAPRDLVFREAKGEWVVCVDSHVMLWPNAVAKLNAWIDANNDSHDLITGPMGYDGLATWATHFDDKWRGQMWGTWGVGWQCACGYRFSPMESKANKVEYWSLATPQANVGNACPQCKTPFPQLAWAGHEKPLADSGNMMLGKIDDEPFEGPAFGLGLFGCRKDAWLGFNEKFRGFGGEEWYIHEKYRQAGHKCMSLPFMRWAHRFGRPDGIPYPLALWHRVRNYVIGHTELGLPLTRIREAFPEGVMPYAEWAQLIANPSSPPEWPIGPQVAPAPANCNGCGEQPPATATLDSVGVNTANLQTYVAKSTHVTDSRLTRGVRNDGTDLLFIGNCRTQQELSTELCTHSLKSRRWIAVHGADNPQIIAALANFLNHESRWFVIDRWPSDGGLIVLSKAIEDKPDEPYFIVDPGWGPGAELAALLSSLGIDAGPACQCKTRIGLLNMMSIKGCEANFDTIVGWLREDAPKYSWMDRIKAAAHAVASGIAFTLNPMDPFPGLVREAIERAKAKRLKEAA